MMRGVRLAYMTLVIVLQAPLAKTPKKAPLAPLQVIAKSVREGILVSSDRNATIPEYIVAFSVFPGNLVRTPPNATSGGGHVTGWPSLERGIDLASMVTASWWESIAHRDWLLRASRLLCFGGFMLPFGRKLGASIFATAFVAAGLVLFMLVIGLNEYTPTPQGLMACAACIFEARASHAEYRALGAGGTSVAKGAQPNGPHAAAAAKTKRSKKAD